MFNPFESQLIKENLMTQVSSVDYYDRKSNSEMF